MTMPRPDARPSAHSRLRRSADIFRAAIDKAVEEGTGLDDMRLRLTLSDASELKRDRTLAIEDISFAGGVMRFLGVKVTHGGVTASTLDLSSGAE